MKLASNDIKGEELGYLGLLAAVIEKLGIIEKIDKRLKLDKDKGGLVTFGQRVAAMILNGLGFINSCLYMTPHFFQNKPIAQLLNAEISAAQLNDDCLGRCLNKIFKYGITKLFSEVMLEIAQENNMLGNRFHLDTTTLVLYGNYENAKHSPIPKYGYSKARRADLKQLTFTLTQEAVAGLPLCMEALDGNSSDKVSLHETVRKVKRFMKEIQNGPDNLCFIVDAAFYDKEKLKTLNDVKWITRVPATLKEAKELLGKSIKEKKWVSLNQNYQITSLKVTIHGLTPFI